MTAQTPEHVCNWAVSTFHTKPDCPDFRTSAAQLKQYRWSDVIRFHFCVIKHIFHSFHPQSLFFWATPIALDCRGPISPPKEGEDFSRQNPQFTAQCVGHITCPTTKYFGSPMTEHKAIHGMTKLLDPYWKHTQLSPFPTFLLQHNLLVSARREMGTWQEAGLSSPPPISLDCLTLFTAKSKQGSIT